MNDEGAVSAGAALWNLAASGVSHSPCGPGRGASGRAAAGAPSRAPCAARSPAQDPPTARPSAQANCEAICRAGAVPHLVALLAEGPESQIATSAAGTLWYLSATELGVRSITQAKGREPLRKLQQAGGGDSSAANYAASALENLGAKRRL